MRRRRSIIAAALVVAGALALTACAGLPTGGGVQEGLPAGSDDGPPEISFRPNGPQPGATPEQIVDGFLLAGSGPAASGGSEWSTAREFLGASFARIWNPSAGVTIDEFSAREPVLVDDDTVEVSIVPVATVDDKGAYDRADGGQISLTFDLGRNADGEWRITQAPDGIVLDSSTFTQVFQHYSLAYFDPTYTFLVPDVRWFPRTNTATRITDALINKPRSDWLAPAVATAFPEGVVANPAVPVTSGVASVTLSEQALGIDQTSLDRMQTQLEVSLGAAGVSEVEMLVDNTFLPAQTVTTRRTAVTGPALALIEQGFGFLTGDELTEIPGLSQAMAEVDPSAIQVAPDRDQAAVRLTDGSVARVTVTDGTAVLDSRPGLVSPTIDPSGAIWTVPRDTPQAVRAFLPDGTTVQVAAAWPGATRIEGMTVSRDGARIAALVTTGNRTSVWISGIVHVDDTPTGLTDPFELGVVDRAGAAIAWLDDTTLGVLATDGVATIVLEQLVGGPGAVTPGPDGAVSIAGANSISSVRLRADDGTLYIKRGANWQETASGILVLATQQGTPE